MDHIDLVDSPVSHGQSLRAGLADLRRYGAEFGDRAAAAAMFKTEPDWYIIYLLVREPDAQPPRRASARRTSHGPRRKKARLAAGPSQGEPSEPMYRPEQYIWRPLRYESYANLQALETSLFVPETTVPNPQAAHEVATETLDIEDEDVLERVQQQHFVWGAKALHLYGVTRVWTPGFGNIAYLRDQAGSQLVAHHVMLVRRLKAAHAASDGIGKEAQEAIVSSAAAGEAGTTALPPPRTMRRIGPGSPRLLLGRALVLRDEQWVIWWCHRTGSSANLRWSKENHVSASQAHEYLLRAVHQSESRLLAAPELRIWGNFVQDDTNLSDTQCRSAMGILAAHYDDQLQHESVSDSDIGFPSEDEDDDDDEDESSSSSDDSDETPVDDHEEQPRLVGLAHYASGTPTAASDGDDEDDQDDQVDDTVEAEDGEEEEGRVNEESIP